MPMVGKRNLLTQKKVRKKLKNTLKRQAKRWLLNLLKKA